MKRKNQHRIRQPILSVSAALDITDLAAKAAAIWKGENPRLSLRMKTKTVVLHDRIITGWSVEND